MINCEIASRIQTSLRFLLKLKLRQLRKEGEKEALHNSRGTFERSICPSIQFPASYTYRTLATKIVAHRGTMDRSTVPSCPTHCHPFPAISSGKGGILCYVVARAYTRLTTGKGWRNGRRSVMRKLPRAIKSRIRRRRGKYHLFPSLSRARTRSCVLYN